MRLMNLLGVFSPDSATDPDPHPLDPAVYDPCPSMTRMGICSVLHPQYEHRIDDEGNYYHLKTVGQTA